MGRPRTLLSTSLAVIAVGCGTPKSEPIDPLASAPKTRSVAPDEPDEAIAKVDGPALTREEIRLVVRAKLPQIRDCFERGIDPGEARARVELRFTIDPDGKARELEVVEDGGEPSVGECLVGQLEHWQFPRPRGGRSVVITYPFAYSSEASLRSAGLPRVEGTITPEAVGAVFDARRRELDVCIPEGVGGTLGVALTIDDAGTVTAISRYAAEGDPLPDAEARCVIQALSTWVFPPAATGDTARVNHDLRW